MSEHQKTLRFADVPSTNSCTPSTSRSKERTLAPFGTSRCLSRAVRQCLATMLRFAGLQNATSLVPMWRPISGEPVLNCGHSTFGHTAKALSQATEHRMGWHVITGCRKPMRLLASFAVVPIGLSAQNLVLNPSFENYILCPSSLHQIDRVVGWDAVFGTPDYFNACDDDSVSVPLNSSGYQWPSHGLGYVGMGFYGELARECVQGRLSSALEPGLPVYVSMRVSPGCFGIPDWTSPALMASHIGLRFSTQPLNVQANYETLLFNTAVIHQPSVLSDTADWVLLSAEFLPDSAYAFLQIGNFYADSLCDWVEADPLGLWGAYAFIDEVCVSREPDVCELVASIGGRHTELGLNGVVFHDVLEIPVESWRVFGPILQLDLYDMFGRLVRSANVFDHSSIRWQLSDLSDGHYALVLRTGGWSDLRIRVLKF